MLVIASLNEKDYFYLLLLGDNIGEDICMETWVRISTGETYKMATV